MISANSLYVRFNNLFLLTILLLWIPAVYGADGAEAGWERQARNVSIVRDDWGIAHITGKTDADAVFGMIYAQAEFSRMN
jgi:acyl-homoserine-lactone acylase